MARPQIRSSQLVMPFGPGAMIDLPEDSVIVSGLDGWRYDPEQPLWVHEARLEQKVNAILGTTGAKLRRPPAASDSPGWDFGKTSVTAYEFPAWFVVQHVEEFNAIRSRRLVPKSALDNGKFSVHGKKYPAIPVRFVRTCPNGHVADLPWSMAVHTDKGGCGGGQLWLQERGPGGDLDQISVACDCGATMKMSQIADIQMHRLGPCDGSRPWLGPNTREGCGESSRLLIRTASNAYFTETISVVSIPESESKLDEALAKLAGQIAMLRQQPANMRPTFLQMIRMSADGAALLGGFKDDEIMAAIDRSAAAVQAAGVRSVKDVEFDALAQARPELGTDKPGGDFFARTLERKHWDEPWMKDVDRVVLVHRLREVTALVGFTRLEPSNVGIDGELSLGVKRAALSIDQNWVPCNENRGEGFFLLFKPEAVRAWRDRTGVKNRKKTLDHGFFLWRQEHENTKRPDVPVEYTMLHTLSHLVMSSIVLECGYPSASIRERIYASDGRYGILIMTASSDAEGTLGGLVMAGRRISHHMRQALELGRLCSNDPICSHNNPADPTGQRLTGAACHGCVLVPETSCEQRNDFLDRTLIVPTVAVSDAAFFTGDAG